MQKIHIILLLVCTLMMLPSSTIGAQGKGNKEKKSKDKHSSVVADTTTKKSDVVADPKEMEMRLMMVDAMLELNEAMLEGVKASIDTLNLPENQQTTKDKDLQLIRMKRQRDRTLLMPYLEHIQDSLTQEVASLNVEKKTLENIINPLKPMAPVVIKNDTLVSGSDMVVYQTTVDEGSGVTTKSVQSIHTIEGDMTKQELASTDAATSEKHSKKKEKAKPSFPSDTVMVYDVAPKNTKLEPKYNFRDTSYLVKATNDANAGLKIKLPNSNDSIVIKPLKKAVKTKEVEKEDLGTIKPDMPGKEPQAVVPRGTRTLTSQDSIQFIKAEFFLQRAKKAIEDKNLRNAEQYITKSIELYPSYYEARLIKADLNVTMGNYADALKEYKACEELNKTKPEVYYGMGILAVKLKKKSEALTYFSTAIKLNPTYVEALMQRGALLHESKRYIEAIIDFGHVIKAEITYYQAYKERGASRMMIKDYSNAADDFTRYLIFEPNNPSVYYLRGLARIANNELMDGCLDLATAAEKGSKEGEKAIKKNCE